MVSEAVASQTREEVSKGLLSDAAEPAGSEPHAFLVALDEAALLELIGHALQTREVARGVVTEDVAQGFLGACCRAAHRGTSHADRAPVPRWTGGDP